MTKPDTSEEHVINLLLGTLDDLELKAPDFTITSETKIHDVCGSSITFGWFIMDIEQYYDISISIKDSVVFFKTVKSVSEYLTKIINDRNHHDKNS